MTLEFEIRTWPDAQPALIDRWTEIIDQSGANPSLGPEWSRLVARAHGMESRVSVVFARTNNSVELVVPTFVEQSRAVGVPIRRIGLVANLVSYHNEVASRLSAEETLNALLFAARFYQADCICIANVPVHSTLGRFLSPLHADRRFAVVSEPGDASPYLPIDSTWEELLACKPKKFRYKLRKRSELVENSDIFEMRWLTNAADCDELLECMRKIEEQSWKKQAGHAIFDSGVEARYHRLLLPFLAENDALLANVLFKNDEPIAYNLCCNWQNWVGQLKTSFDKRYSALSPGSLVIDKAIQRAIELGAQEFDFLGHTDPHKLAWTKDIREHSNFYLYPRSSLKGRFIAKIKQARRSIYKQDA